MKRSVKLNFGERMREWRHARREYVEKIKQQLKEKMKIDESYPKLTVPAETKALNLSPTAETELKSMEVSTAKPANHIEAAIQYLREKANEI